MSFELRPYQREAVDSVGKFFMDGGQDPVMVLPTGAGKSVILAALVSEYHRAYGTRFMVVSHVAELLIQDHDAIHRYDPELHTGLYSAGIGLRQPRAPICVAGIQSCFKKAKSFGHRDILIVDEAHMIAPKAVGRYRAFIDAMREINPNLRVVGLTATHFRLGWGFIHEGDGALFTGICHETPITFLIDNGYLVKPVCRSGSVTADMTGVKHVGGEWNEKEMSERFERITVEACIDIIKKSAGRKCRMIFCSSCKHAREVAACLKDMGCDGVRYVDGKTPKGERKEIVDDTKAGRVQWLVNVSVFTTGFDAGIIDVIVFLRATESTGLYCQIIGRGLRLWPDKTGCLVLDYADVVRTHGPLNALRIKTPNSKKSNAPAAKICPSCEVYVAITANPCPECGYEWPPAAERTFSHDTEAAEIDLIQSMKPHWRDVRDIKYQRNRKAGKPDTMKVTYICGLGAADRISEWVCLDHTGYAKGKATAWAREAGFAGDPETVTVSEALEIFWKTPFKICIQNQPSGYPKILSRDYVGIDIPTSV